MKINEYLAKNYPNIKSVIVTVCEVCEADHPPKSKKWCYDESSDVTRYGEMYLGKTSRLTSEFDATLPIVRFIRSKIERQKLAPYQADGGKSVTRRCTVKVEFK